MHISFSGPRLFKVGLICVRAADSRELMLQGLIDLGSFGDERLQTYGPPRRQVVSVVQPERSAQTYPAFRYEPLAKMEIRAFWSS
jgi:hypothetical protein